MKKPLSIRNLLLLTIGALSLLVALFTLQQVVQEGRRMETARSLKAAMLLADQLFEGTEKLTVERDTAFFMLHAKDPDVVSNLARDLQDSRHAADAALGASLAAIGSQGFADISAPLKDSLSRLGALKDLRAQVDAAAALPPEKRDGKIAEAWFRDTTGLITETRGLWTGFTTHYDDIDPRVTLHLRFKKFFGNVSETSGEERALIGRLLVENAPATPDEQAQLLRWQGTAELAWASIGELAEQGRLLPAIGPALTDARSHYFNLHDMVKDLFYVPGAAMPPPYPISADLWLELTTQDSESLYALKDAALTATQGYVTGLETEAWHAILLRLAVLCVALGLCYFCFRVVTRRVLQPIHDIVEALLGATQGKAVPVTSAVAGGAAGRDDEIGKLAQVLSSFQKTMDDIRRSNIELERSNRELDDFAYIASHDLREPLRGIHNHSRFLREDNAEKLDPESLSRIDRLLYLSQRIERLVNDLLYFSRLGRQELAIQRTDLNEVMRDIESTIDVFLEQHHARIVLPKALPVIVCDRTRITEVYRNLIVNAVKYNSSPEKTVEIGCLDVFPGGGGKALQNVFYVRDNGHGIAPEFHADIFRIFRRLEASRPDQEEGTGVGLTFVKKIVERHGGRIWLDSAPGKGTTFYFTLREEEHQQDDRKAVA